MRVVKLCMLFVAMLNAGSVVACERIEQENDQHNLEHGKESVDVGGKTSRVSTNFEYRVEEPLKRMQKSVSSGWRRFRNAWYLGDSLLI